MADQKKTQAVADDRKASGIAQEQPTTPAPENKKRVRKAPKVKKPRKKGLPIAVDILIVISLLALIAAAVWGVYALADYYATHYEKREITYTLLASEVDAALALDAEGNCVILPQTDVFVVDGEQSIPVGRVLSVTYEQNGQDTVDVYVTVRATADYGKNLGYFVNETKIAVGKAYTCRFSGMVSDTVTVELQITEGES